jgi:hypothetical protein
MTQKSPYVGCDIRMHRWFDRQFPCCWIGCHGPAEWPLRSPYLILLDIYLWGHLKAMVFQVKIQSMDHLKERVRDAYACVTLDVLKQVRCEWERRICVCYQCHGAHTENFFLIKQPFSPCVDTFESSCNWFSVDGLNIVEPTTDGFSAFVD